MSLFESTNTTTAAPAKDVFSEELEREKARRAAKAQLDAEEAAERARVEKAEAEAEAIRKANEPKFINYEDFFDTIYRTRLLGYPAKLASWGILAVGAMMSIESLTKDVISNPPYQVIGITIAGFYVTNKIANWLIGKRDKCKVCGAIDSFTKETEDYKNSESGDTKTTKETIVTTCSGCKNFNRTTWTSTSKSQAARDKEDRVDSLLRRADRADRKALSASTASLCQTYLSEAKSLRAKAASL